MKRPWLGSIATTRLSLWIGYGLLGLVVISAPVLAAKLATVLQTSHWRQVTDPVYPLPPEEDGSHVVSLTGSRPISLASPHPDFVRVDEYTFSTRFPWNWDGARTVVFADDLGEETTVEVAPGLTVPFAPLDHEIPVLHISCDSTALWDPAVGIYCTGNSENFLQRGSDWERSARFEYYLPGSGKVIDEPIGLRIHGGYGRYYYQKGLRFYFDDYGSSDLLNFPFFESGPTLFERLIVRASRYDDACINSNLAETLFADLGHLASRYQFVALYLNQEYWGAYSLRERLDDEFFRSTWQLGFGGLNIIKDGETKYGNGDSWWDFLESFSQVNNPNNDQWFDSVRTNLDLASYIDWQIINMFCVAGDNGFAWNLALFQTGQEPWRFVMWDEDLLFDSDDLNTNMFRFFTSRNEEEWNQYRAPSDLRGWSAEDQQWMTMFRTLLGNEDFRDLFRGRLEHLLDGAMSTDNLIGRVNGLAEDQIPEIPGHAQRWEGFESHWYESNLERTRGWITERRPLFLAQADSFYSEFSMPSRSTDFTGLFINEFLASNNSYGQDETGEYAGWVEVYNGGSAALNLTGLHLTNDPNQTTKWEFPAVILPVGERLIVWCDEDAGQGPLHANFGLNNMGGSIGLYGPLVFGNEAIDTREYGLQTTDVSEGLTNDGGHLWAALDPPTFNRANGDSTDVPPYVPGGVVFNQNFPNPFNGGTTLEFGLPQSGHVRVSVYDVRGRLVGTMVDENRAAGIHLVQWAGEDHSGRPLPSGLYVARMQFGGIEKTRNMTLVR